MDKYSKSNKNTTRLIGNFNNFTGASGEFKNSDYNGIILHENKLLPCFYIDEKILIKNHDTIKVEYDKWLFIVYNIINIKKSEMKIPV